MKKEILFLSCFLFLFFSCNSTREKTNELSKNQKKAERLAKKEAKEIERNKPPLQEQTKSPLLKPNNNNNNTVPRKLESQ